MYRDVKCCTVQDPVFISRLCAYNVNHLMEVVSEAEPQKISTQKSSDLKSLAFQLKTESQSLIQRLIHGLFGNQTFWEAKLELWFNFVNECAWQYCEVGTELLSLIAFILSSNIFQHFHLSFASEFWDDLRGRDSSKKILCDADQYPGIAGH